MRTLNSLDYGSSREHIIIGLTTCSLCPVLCVLFSASCSLCRPLFFTFFSWLAPFYTAKCDRPVKSILAEKSGWGEGGGGGFRGGLRKGRPRSARRSLATRNGNASGQEKHNLLRMKFRSETLICGFSPNMINERRPRRQTGRRSDSRPTLLQASAHPYVSNPTRLVIH